MKVAGTLLWLVVCLMFIYLVDLFTINPTITSGNGNLGLLFVFPAMVAYFLFAKSLWNVLGKLELTSSTWRKISLAGIALLAIFGFLEYYFTMNLMRDLGGSPGKESSKIYRYPWINQYTNTILINFYTLGIWGTVVTLIKTTTRKISTYSDKPTE